MFLYCGVLDPVLEGWQAGNFRGSGSYMPSFNSVVLTIVLQSSVDIGIYIYLFIFIKNSLLKNYIYMLVSFSFLQEGINNQFHFVELYLLG